MSSDITHTRTKHTQSLCITANISSKTRISLRRENIHLHQVWYQLQCPSVQPFMQIPHILLYKCDTFLTTPATEQLWMTDHISNVSICCSVLKNTNLIMTHGFFTTSFMLPEGLICRSLEICAYCTCEQTYQLIFWGEATFCTTTIYDFTNLITWRLCSFRTWHHAAGTCRTASQPRRH
jgi:hypothetical protein